MAKKQNPDSKLRAYFRKGERLITTQEKLFIRTWFAEGLTAKEIAKKLSCDTELIINCIPLKYFVKPTQ